MEPSQRIFLQFLLVIALIAFVVGILTPIVTIEKFYLIDNTFSIISAVVQLLLEGRYFLFLLISVFSLGLPLLKLGVLYTILDQTSGQQHNQRYLHWMHQFGKWSMLDVFVVAVMVVSVKLGAIVQVEMRYGLYAFALSVILTMFITARVVKLTANPEP